MRYLFDTNVILAALRSDRGASRKLLICALNREVETLASVALMLEYEAVLTRPEHLAGTGLTREETNTIIDALASLADPVRLRFLWRPRLADPGDEMVLEAAVNGRADRLVTFNIRHLLPAAREFGIMTVTPPQAWKEIERRNEKK